MTNQKAGIAWAIIAIAIFGNTSQQASAGFLIGSTFQVAGTNTPDNFTATITLSPGTTLIDNGHLSLTQSIIDQGGSQWLNLDFEATNGLLSNNPNSFWQLYITNITLASQELATGKVGYFTVDGKPVEPIQTFYGFSAIVPNPLDISHENVYGFLNYSNIVSKISENASSTPYSTIGYGGMNTGTVTGFDVAFRISPLVSVPEPSTLRLSGLALIFMGMAYGRRMCQIK